MGGERESRIQDSLDTRVKKQFVFFFPVVASSRAL